MTLAELNHAIFAIRRRLRADQRRVQRTVLEEATVRVPGPPTVADLERLLRRQGELRTTRARTLAAHPDVVDLLARRHVLRVHVGILQALLDSVRATRPPRADAACLTRVLQLRGVPPGWGGPPSRVARRTVPVRRCPAVDVNRLQERAAAAQLELGAVETELTRVGWIVGVPVPPAAATGTA